ncbi:ATP-dependent translocase ABCB1-like isoform X2 [Ptychodera flava]|uniref:ATP-dependent translocase ABCB1-like isoform X2 n=1 Tax=Ptychodera flava TaxID=63121 RepID=UPI00396A2178
MASHDEEKEPLLKDPVNAQREKYGGASGEDGSQESGDGQGDAGSDEVKVKAQPATLGQLFRYSTWLDVFLMEVGSFFALVHGAGWPVLMIVFGQMTNLFIEGPGAGNMTMPSPLPTMNTLPPMNFTNGSAAIPIYPFAYPSTKAWEDEMTKYAIYYCIIGGAIFLAAYFEVALWTMSCERQTHKLRKAFFKSILRQEIGWFDKHQSGELTTRLSDDLEQVRTGIGDKFCLMIQFTSAFLCGFAIAFSKSWKLSLVMMSMTPLLAIAAAVMGKVIASFATREQEAYAQAGSVAEEVLSCIRTVTCFNGQAKECERYEHELETAKTLGIRKSFTTGVSMGVTMLVIFSAYALAFWYGPTLVSDGELTGGEVLTVFFCVMIGSFSIGNIGPNLQFVATAKGAAGTLIKIIDNVPSIDSDAEEGERLTEVRGHIEFDSVDFAYPTRENVTVLQNFCITAQPGQTVALVGASGCGKSTVVNLLLRFYDTLAGSIHIDGHDIRSLNIRSLRQLIGVVSQEPVLFGYTIKENISLGHLDATDAEIIQAAKNANAHDFITSLPQGYDTLVGERGAQLSGGQKQRVAIARALVRDPKILLLDEATSALDSESEKVVQAALDKALQGRTTIVIAHRLSTIQNADLIIAMENGEVKEQGTHAELMKHDGVYKQLVMLQMVAGEDGSGGQFASEIALTDEEIVRLKRQSSLKRQDSLKRQKSVKDDKKKEEIEEEVEPAKYFRILSLNSPEWYYIVVGCFWATVAGVTFPIWAIFFSEVVNLFTLPPDEMKSEAFFWSMMYLALGGTIGLSNFFFSWMFGVSGERLTKRMRSKAFKAMLRQDIGWFDDPKHNTGALTTRLATDASNIKNATGVRIGSILQSLVSMIAALVIAFIYGWQLALAILACIPLVAMAGFINMKVVHGNQKKDQQLLENAGKTAAEAIENMRTVASLTREPTFYETYCEHLKKPYSNALKNAQVYGLAYGFSQGIMFFLYAAAFRFGAYLVGVNAMEMQNVFKVFFAIAFAGMAVGQSASFLPDFSKAKHSASLIFKLLDTVPEIDIYTQWGEQPFHISGEVCYENVYFNYLTRPDVKVLKGANVSVKPGQIIALVGASGCGKSTIVSLLERFYNPEGGKIMLDGRDIKQLNLHWLRAQMSIVSQEPVLFNCSIAENIAYGVDSDVPHHMIEDAAKTANIHDFIANLPKGYDTVVGEKGTQLSGGQKQRVAIARALIRNPTVLLLDEATSALDTESEKIVQKALDNAMTGRSCIVIAHRLSTIQNANQIFVIEDGRVVEEGNHQQLLSLKGAYYTLTSGQRLA